MNENKVEEQYQKVFEEHGRLLKDFHREHLILSMENIRQKRGLIHLFILVSSGIIGALLVFEKSNLIKNNGFVIIGSTFFLIVILYGFYYLTRILTKEGDIIDSFAKDFLSGLELVRNSYEKYFSNTTEDNLSSIKNSQRVAIEKMDFQSINNKKAEKKFKNGLYFIFGLFFLVLSILDIQKVFFFLKL